METLTQKTKFIEFNRHESAMQKACAYLELAKRAFEKYQDARMKADSYDSDALKFRAHTLYTKKWELEHNAIISHMAFTRLFKAYRRILFNCFTK